MGNNPNGVLFSLIPFLVLGILFLTKKEIFVRVITKKENVDTDKIYKSLGLFFMALVGVGLIIYISVLIDSKLLFGIAFLIFLTIVIYVSREKK